MGAAAHRPQPQRVALLRQEQHPAEVGGRVRPVEGVGAVVAQQPSLAGGERNAEPGPASNGGFFFYRDGVDDFIAEHADEIEVVKDFRSEPC